MLHEANRACPHIKDPLTPGPGDYIAYEQLQHFEHGVGGGKAFGRPDEVCKKFVDNCVDGARLADITNDELINEIGMTKLQVKRLRRELKALHVGE